MATKDKPRSRLLRHRGWEVRVHAPEGSGELLEFVATSLEDALCGTLEGLGQQVVPSNKTKSVVCRQSTKSL